MSHCILLYTDIYIAPLMAYAKQRRSECISAPGKRLDLRRDIETKIEEERIEERREGGRQLFSYALAI